MPIVKVGSQRASANIVPGSLDVKARTVEVTFATSRPVLTRNWSVSDGKFFEILSFDKGHVRMERLNSGAPVLDSHDTWTRTADLPGTVVKAWIADGEGRALLRFSNDKSTVAGVPDGPGEKIMNKVAEGIARGISVGYNVYSYEEVESADSTSIGAADKNKIPTYRSVDWEPFEVTFAPIPADIGAGVRSKEQESTMHEVEVKTLNNTNNNTDMFRNQRMQRDHEGGTGAGGGSAASGNAAENQAPAGGDQTRAAGTPPAPPVPPTPAAVGNDAITQERQRADQIMQSAQASGVPMEFARKLITDGVELSRALGMIIAEYSKKDDEVPSQNSTNRSAHVVSDTEVDNRRQGMTDAILHRIAPQTPLTDLGREYRGMSLLDMSREILQQGGIKVRGMSPREVATNALNIGDIYSTGSRGGGMMSTSDFPLILGNTINRTLRAEYAVQERTFMPFVRQVSAKDFRPMTSVQSGEVNNFEEVKEGGEYRRDSFNEAAESYKVKKYGKIIPITWEALVNDDLGVFTKLIPKIAAAAARTQSDIVWSMILGNPMMADGNLLFSNAHHNVASAAAITINSMGAARLLLRNQMGLNGKDYLNLTPKFMLVGPTNEQLALQYHSSNYTPTIASDQNVWKGLTTPIVEPRITNSDWYFVASPSSIDTVEIAFLEGEGELFTESRTGFDVDGMETKARMVFGAKVIDWRGFAKVPGV